MNTKAVMVYLALFVILLVLAFVVLPGVNEHKATTTTTVAAVTTLNQTVQNTTTQTTTIFRNYSSCISTNENQSIFNGNFSTGTYAGWSSTSVGFGNAPDNITKLNAEGKYYSRPWSGVSSNFFASNYNGSLELVGGNLTSEPFLVTEPYLNLKIVSPKSNLLYIEILHNSTPVITTYFDSYAVPGNSQYGQSTFMNASINMLPLICEQAQIKVVALTELAKGANYNYIAVTDFYLSKRFESSPDIIVNQVVNLTG